jgi:hypothetical protein
MAKYKLEYIWLDGYTPLANLRSKTQIKDFASFPKLGELPDWGFDGSSTQQAEGKSSDIVLKPVAVFPDSTRKNGVLVMCECFQHTGVPSPSNSRATIPDDAGTWFGGLSKRKLPSVENGGRLRFIDECVRAERTHLALIGAIPLFVVWNSPSMFAGNVAFALVGNIPCWMIARYNRARLMNIAAKTSRLA